jgi:hypothetical protein
MLAICPGCDAIHDGIADHCDHCFVHGLCDTGREISSRIARLICPQPKQREYATRLVKAMTRQDLRELILRLFEASSPVERSMLLDLIAEVHVAPRFREGRR